MSWSWLLGGGFASLKFMALASPAAPSDTVAVAALTVLSISFCSFSSSFARDCACVDLEAFAEKRRMKSFKSASSASCFSYRALATAMRSSRASRNAAKFPVYQCSPLPLTSATWSQAPSMSSCSCETITVVHGESLIQRASQLFAASSRWFVGSSSNSKPASPDPAGDSNRRANATRICHPPLRSSHFASHCVRANPRPSSTLLMRFSASYPPAMSNSASASISASALRQASSSSAPPPPHRASASRSAFSAALTRSMRERASWYTVSCDPETAVCSKYPTASSREMAIVPSCSERLPAMHFRSVLLPHPLPPTSATFWPGMTSTDALLSRSTSPTESMASEILMDAPLVSP